MKYREDWDLKTIPDPQLNSEFARRRSLKRKIETTDDPALAEARQKQREYRAKRRKEGKDKWKPS